MYIQCQKAFEALKDIVKNSSGIFLLCGVNDTNYNQAIKLKESDERYRFI
jgi:uncharacterized protein YeaO (DUF488 family)